MVELPDDFADEQRQTFTPHASDAAHLPLHDAPEALYVVRVDVTADVLAAGVVHELVDVAKLRQPAVHLEAIRVHPRAGSDAFLNRLEDVLDVEFFRLDVYEHLAGFPRK